MAIAADTCIPEMGFLVIPGISAAEDGGIAAHGYWRTAAVAEDPLHYHVGLGPHRISGNCRPGSSSTSANYQYIGLYNRSILYHSFLKSVLVVGGIECTS